MILSYLYTVVTQLKQLSKLYDSQTTQCMQYLGISQVSGVSGRFVWWDCSASSTNKQTKYVSLLIVIIINFSRNDMLIKTYCTD